MNSESRLHARDYIARLAAVRALSLQLARGAARPRRVRRRGEACPEPAGAAGARLLTRTRLLRCRAARISLPWLPSRRPVHPLADGATGPALLRRPSHRRPVSRRRASPPAGVPSLPRTGSPTARLQQRARRLHRPQAAPRCTRPERQYPARNSAHLYPRGDRPGPRRLPASSRWIDQVATVLGELAEKLDADKLVAVADTAPPAWAQRLGYLSRTRRCGREGRAAQGIRSGAHAHKSAVLLPGRRQEQLRGSRRGLEDSSSMPSVEPEL